MTDSPIRTLVTRWRDDAGATYRSWFLWEERLKNFRSIRRGLALVALEIEAGTFGNAYRDSSLETVVESVPSSATSSEAPITPSSGRRSSASPASTRTARTSSRSGASSTAARAATTRPACSPQSGCSTPAPSSHVAQEQLRPAERPRRSLRRAHHDRRPHAPEAEATRTLLPSRHHRDQRTWNQLPGSHAINPVNGYIGIVVVPLLVGAGRLNVPRVRGGTRTAEVELMTLRHPARRRRPEGERLIARLHRM